MPTLSASDYTQYIKMKAAAASYTNGIPKKIQTVDQPVPNINILNSIIKTSQASLVVDPRISNLVGNTRVQPIQPMRVNRPDARSTVAYSTGGTTTSSKFQQPGGLPASGKVGTYTRLPQNAGWQQGGTIG